jgi:hypothetical protein
LRKPIEYFFGENFGGEEIQDLVSILRSQSPEYRKANVEYIQKTVRLQTLGYEISNNPEEEITEEQIKEFMELLIDLTNKNKYASNQVENATKRLLTEIDFKGIDLSGYQTKID